MKMIFKFNNNYKALHKMIKLISSLVPQGKRHKMLLKCLKKLGLCQLRGTYWPTTNRGTPPLLSYNSQPVGSLRNTMGLNKT